MPQAVFDRRLLRQRRQRAAATLGDADFVIRHAAGLLAERLGDVSRSFERVLLLPSHQGRVRSVLGAAIPDPVESDLAGAMVPPGARGLVADDEALPFGKDTFDLVVACFGLHWVNDLPGTLIQIRHALEPDGLFLGAFAGGSTLRELRTCLLEAEAEIEGGAGLRVSPFTDVRDAGALLQRAGFALPVVDVEPLIVTYAHPLTLLQELRRMGETSALEGVRKPLGRAVLARALELYAERFSDPRGRIRATFELIMVSGWKPDPRQQQPARRGSGQASLARALGVPPEVLEGKTGRSSE